MEKLAFSATIAIIGIAWGAATNVYFHNRSLYPVIKYGIDMMNQIIIIRSLIACIIQLIVAYQLFIVDMKAFALFPIFLFLLTVIFDLLLPKPVNIHKSHPKARTYSLIKDPLSHKYKNSRIMMIFSIISLAFYLISLLTSNILWLTQLSIIISGISAFIMTTYLSLITTISIRKI